MEICTILVIGYVPTIARFCFQNLLRIFVIYLDHGTCFSPAGVPLLYILTRSPFFRACLNLMFLPLDWILPASRIRLDLMIACMFFSFVLVDVFQAGLWSERFQPMFDKLKSLADSLPAFVLCSKVTSSNVKYKNAWLHWKKWEKVNLGFNQFPVSPFLFCLYLREKFACTN